MTGKFTLIFKLTRGDTVCLGRKELEFDDEEMARYVFGALSDQCSVDDEIGHYNERIAEDGKPSATEP